MANKPDNESLADKQISSTEYLRRAQTVTGVLNPNIFFQLIGAEISNDPNDPPAS